MDHAGIESTAEFSPGGISVTSTKFTCELANRILRPKCNGDKTAGTASVALSNGRTRRNAWDVWPGRSFFEPIRIETDRPGRQFNSNSESFPLHGVGA